MENDFLERIAIEGNQLVERITKLGAFCDSEKFKTLSANQRQLLTAQEAIMTSYLAILNLRLIDFGIEPRFGGNV